LCPRCGKTLIPYSGFTAGMIYDCKNCGYHGPISMSESKIDDKSKKIFKEKH